MNLSHPWMLHFLWLLPLAVLAFVVRGRKVRQSLERFADPELLNRLIGEGSGGMRAIKPVLWITALGFMLIALAGPRWGSHYQEVVQKGVDIMLLVDVSPSMLVQDVKPDRLERARREISDFIKVVQGDRVGLVAFSGAAFVQCPLTLDYGALNLFLNALSPGLIPAPGTDLGAAIETGMSAFDPEAETDKVIILITDGEDNEAGGVQAAREAAAKGIKIFVFGIGDPSGGPIPQQEGKGGFRKDKDGNMILSKLDEQDLQEIASITGGRYVRAVSGDLDLDLLYFDGVKLSTEATTLKSGKIKVFEERFYLFVLVAFVSLLLEGFIQIMGKKSPLSRKGRRFFLFSVYFLAPVFIPLIMAGWSAPVFGSEDPDELYREGRFKEAEKLYGKSDMDNPKDLRFRYNRGCAGYQGSDYKGAMAAFSSVYRRAQNKEMQYKAVFNAANTAFKQGDFGTATEYFKQAIRLKPDSENAKFNLELALREIAKQKEQEKQAGDDSSKEQENKGQESSKEEKKGKDGEKKGGPEKEKEKKKDPSGEQDKKEGSSEKGKNDQQGRGEEKKEDKKDLSGDLQAKNAPSESKKEDEEANAEPVSISRSKAEAMLDNVKEDRTRLMELQLQERGAARPASGKDW